MLESSQSPASSSVVPSTSFAENNASAPVEQALLGRSLVIKGELSGAESLYIEGSVEGAIFVDGQRLTIGRAGKVNADITAKEVVIMGNVEGSVDCEDRLDIRREGSLTGDATMRSLSVEDGAVLKGKFEIRNVNRVDEEQQTIQIEVKPAIQSAPEPAPTDIPPVPQPKAVESRVSAITRAARIRGSRILYQEVPKS